MPGQIMPLAEMRERYMQALEVGVAHAEITVRNAMSFLAPKRTDALASEIEANRTNRSGLTVTGRVHTNSEDYYGIMNEQKGWYKHPRGGEAHYAANALLGSIPEIQKSITEAVAAVE